MKKVIVLGAGMVGRAIALDLSKYYTVTSVDRDEKALAHFDGTEVSVITADLASPAVVRELVTDADLVVGAVPGFMGYVMLRTLIEAGKHVVDISFFDEDPFELDQMARDAGLTIVVDCGVAPGMDNVLLGYHSERMQVRRFECLVGGLPRERHWPYEYKAPFSPIDVIEEYTRPARIVEGGQIVIKEALSDCELLNFEGVGTLESFNSDGLRSLIKTMPDIPEMIEKTLRFPGHVEKMKVLRETGFFSKEHIDIYGKTIRPLDLTAKLLFPIWKLEEGEREFTIMRVTIEGWEDGAPKTYEYNLLDHFDDETGISSMSRTTGYTCTAAARLVLEGKYAHRGISPPEYLGRKQNDFEFILKHLAERGVHYRKKTH